MSLGLKRGTVELFPHDPEWEIQASIIIRELRDAFSYAATDIRHVGSTAIKTVSAKPIIDIAVGVEDLKWALERLPYAAAKGYTRKNFHNTGEIFLSRGNDIEDTRDCHVHVVLIDSRQWHDYMFFIDYLNKNTQAAKEYERLKLSLAKEYRFDRGSYTDGKAEFIEAILSLRKGREYDKTCEIVP